MNEQLIGQPLGRPGAMRPLPSLAGFWMRVLAFLIDIIFLHFLFRSLIALTGDFVFDHPQLCRVLSALVLFAYFVLLNGPLGRGSTLAKTILDLRVTDSVGAPLSWSAAMIRTAVQMPYALIAYFALTFVAAEDPTPRQFWMQNMMSVYLGMAWTFGNIMACGLNPYRQAFHDFAVGSFVRRRRTEAMPFSAMQTQLGMAADRLHSQPQRSGAVSVALIWLTLGVLTWGSGKPMADAEALIAGVRALERDPKFQEARFGAMMVVPDPRPLAVPTDGETTGTTATNTGDRRVAVLSLSKLGLWEGSADDPALRAAVEAAAENYLRLLEQHNPEQREYEGELSIRVTLQSFAALALVRPTRLFVEYELPGRAVQFRRRSEGS